ncbi:MAG: 1-acyl-sn-glycerol-3-phosphate acyltransferase [Gemmatimonadota bacterium]|nr:1-acyl-sn-glycerol-3-phosphate acyltransferase [Gemmatimonadota bacterium]
MSPLSLIVTPIAMAGVALSTLIVGSAAVIAGMIGFSEGPGSPYHLFAPLWSRLVLFFSFVRVKVHNPERALDGSAHIFVANHLSWYDVPVLSSFLPRAKFVTKEELFSVPIFGKAMRAIGMVPIQRNNKRAAFASYDKAAASVGLGNSIVVFAEGTRGVDYPLRPFKKGPFVLATSAGVTVVPVLIHGAREVLPRGSLFVRPRRVDVHLLEPISVEGLDASARNGLANEVWSRMAEALEKLYGIESGSARPAATVRAAV